VSPRLAAAPVSWGVWERTVDRDDLAPPDLLLENIASLGYTAIELGPAGYFGADADSVGAELRGIGFELVGAFVPLRLSDDDGFRVDLDELDRVLAILRSWPDAVALLADAGTPERFAAAGQPDELRRTALQGDAFDAASARLERAAERCADAGVTAALHPEVGSFAEAPAEVEAFLGRIDPELLGVCLDSGHTLIGGGDPVELARDWHDRLRHVHLKDVASEQLARVRAGKLDVERAWEQGLFCPFGEGEVDLRGLLALPELASFPGWIVLEQDRIAVRADDLPDVRAVEERNLEFVRALIR
jgi:inosose dehydratase